MQNAMQKCIKNWPRYKNKNDFVLST